MLKLREYQKKAVSDVHNWVQNNTEPCCLFSAGGTGKSIMIAKVVQDLVSQDKHVCVMVNISKLIPQLSKLFDKLKITHNVIKAGHKRDWDDDAMVHIVMQQTLYARKEVKPKCDVLIIDEYHISFDTPSMNEVVERLEPRNIVGYSATPIDAKGEPLDGVELIEAIQVKEATEQGFLTPVRTFVAGFSERMDFDDADDNRGDYNEVKLAKIVNTESYNKNVFESWYNLAKERKTIVFCTGVQHAEDMNILFNINGVKSLAVHSQKSQKENDASFLAFEKDEVQVLCSIGMISTGWDEPSVSCGISCRPTKSKRLYLQQAYRVDRLFAGKKDSLWLDFAKNTSEHGLYDEGLFEYVRENNVDGTRSHEKIEGISLLVPEEKDLVELESRVKINLMVEEVKSHKKKGGSLKDLIELFEVSQDIYEMSELLVQIDLLFNGRKNKPDTAMWIANKWHGYLYQYPEYRSRWLKAFKTRAKTLVQSGRTNNPKKINSIHFFIEWLFDNREPQNNNFWFNK